MAWRIENAIVRGEIDNTLPGRTTGYLWLIHREQPLEINLVGDCWRDLAGAVLTFRNPQPDFSLEGPDLSDPQSGVVGDMTASRKGKVPHADRNEEGFTWQNHLSLEWFDEVNGRVLIETPHYELHISERNWELSCEDEEKQKRMNQEALRNFIYLFLQRGENGDLWTQENADEYAWEQRFRESDRLTEAFQDLVEKYAEDPDSQEKLSYAMGWDQMLGEEEDDFDFETEVEHGIDVEEASELTADDEWEMIDEWEDFMEEEFGDYIVHPLQLKAHDVANAAIELFGDRSELNGPESRLCALLMQIAAKLAGALNFSGESFEQEPGYILALLKRCLHWQNDAISTCQELLSLCKDPEQERALLVIRDSIFAVRDQITELRREYKQN